MNGHARATAPLPSRALLTRLRELKGQWRDQVLVDRALSHTTFKVAYVMADFMTMNESARRFRESGQIIVFPSQAELCHRTNASINTVGSSIAQMIRRGHLRKLETGNQVLGSSTYQIIIKRGAADA